MPDLPAKVCASCARAFTWRKKWERDWEHVRYCSDRCRRRGVRPLDERLEAAILALLDTRAPGASICPSDAARAVAADDPGKAAPDDWRDLMEPARMAARRLVERGQAEITQGGRVVDPTQAKGPIRVRLARSATPTPRQNAGRAPNSGRV